MKRAKLSTSISNWIRSRKCISSTETDNVNVNVSKSGILEIDDTSELCSDGPAADTDGISVSVEVKFAEPDSDTDDRIQLQDGFPQEAAPTRLACTCIFQALLKLNTDHLESQIQVARNMLLQTRPKTTLLMYAQLSAMSCAFPDLLALFKLALTVPVASASAERSFSAMRRIKTYLRASMSANRTSDLTVLSVERQLSSRIMEDPSSTITAFAHTHEKATNSTRVAVQLSDSTLTLNSLNCIKFMI